MTKSPAPSENNSPARTLSWWIAGGALLVYWTTLNHWVSLTSLRTVAGISDWFWQPEAARPLAWLVFTPFRLLPAAWLPLTLNLITAGGAALVLGQLARSVAILRLDVVSADPMRKKISETAILTGPTAWLPPVIAALALGLQLGFWEHATSASGEILSVLGFAFAFRGVLEYRLAREEKWLFRAAFAFAAGMADNWLLLGYLPVFIAGTIWAKGFSPFLEGRFLIRMSGWALMGLSLYLLPPLLLAVNAPDQWDFGAALKWHLGTQQSGLFVLRSHAFRLMALTGLLPFLLLAVRWRSHSVQLADDTHLGMFFTKLSGHFIHASFLVTSLWLTLQPVFTPRQLELYPPPLVYFYPWALVAGYGTAYLLVFGWPRGNRSPARWPAWTAKSLLIVVPALLLWKNLGDVRLTNGGAVREFARQLYADLPTGNATALSDDPQFLLLLRAELAAHAAGKNPLLVDTRSLPRPDYHHRLAHDYPGRWPALSAAHSNGLGALAMVNVISQVASNEPVVYLHPSSGLFFERFHATPRGWAQLLQPRPAAGSAPVTTTTNDFSKWENRWNNPLAQRADQITAHRRHAAIGARPAFKRLKLSGRANETALFLAGVYAKTLNHWGAELARRGEWVAASEWYQRAIAFDPDNLAARINLEFAARQQRGESNRLTLAEIKTTFADTLAKFDTWADVVSRNGPVDEPTSLLQVGRMYFTAANPRQARERFARSAELAPDWIAPKLGLAQCHNLTGDFAAAEALTAELLAAETFAKLRGPALAQLLQVRTMALRRLNRSNEASAFIEQFATTHQAAPEVISTAADLLAAAGQFETELKWRDLLVQRDPKRIEWLVKKGHAELRAKQFEPAIKTLTAALGLMPANANARLFRAIASLRAGQLEAAQSDFQQLLKSPDHAPSALFGLGGIAWRQHDTNAMIQYYQAFLTNSAASPQTAVATQRLKEWQDE